MKAQLTGAIIGGVLFAAVGLAIISTAPADALQSTYADSDGTITVIRWELVWQTLIAIVGTLVGTYGGVKAQDLFYRLTGQHVPDRLMPDDRLKGSVDDILRRILGSDLPPAEQAKAIGLVLGDKP